MPSGKTSWITCRGSGESSSRPGTKETTTKIRRTSELLPLLKAMQKFDASTSPMVIENGIYDPLGHTSGAIRRGTSIYDGAEAEIGIRFRHHRSTSDYSRSSWGRKDIANIGGATGLGSSSSNNEKLAESGRRAFFDWTSAHDEIATARGGGGGLALWNRVVD